MVVNEEGRNWNEKLDRAVRDDVFPILPLYLYPRI